MKILVLCSGGDAPGMNKFLWEMFAAFKDDLYFAYAGFKGLVEGDIRPISSVAKKDLQNKAGTITKSSRLPQFKERAVFAKGLANAKNFDCVVILGGNGSEKGAKELFENGVNTIFVPGTIDNDVQDSFYSIGFSTAVKECVYAFENSMPSLHSFNMSCIFEVMGKQCPMIAKEVARQTNANILIAEKQDLKFDEIAQTILQRWQKGESTSIILRENIVDAKKMAEKLNQMLEKDLVRFHIVGRTQRGGKPTKEELVMAKKIAKETIFCIKNKVFGVRILVEKDMEVAVHDFA